MACEIKLGDYMTTVKVTMVNGEIYYAETEKPLLAYVAECFHADTKVIYFQRKGKLVYLACQHIASIEEVITSTEETDF